MSLKNYISKINLALRISRKYSFVKLLINSKKYSAYQKGKRSNKIEEEIVDYDFKIDRKPFQLAMRTYRGDIDIFYEVFWREVYHIPNNYIKNPKIIIDLGAHIGLASIYFATRYPNAKILSVEASATNFQLLESNTKSFKNIQSVHEAVYSNDGWVNFDDEGVFSYNTKISETGTPVQCISMISLMSAYAIEYIDLLKIDIEGAEAALLSKHNDWLHKVQHIIIELHQPYDLEKLAMDLQPFGFKFYLPENDKELRNIFLSK